MKTELDVASEASPPDNTTTVADYQVLRNSWATLGTNGDYPLEDDLPGGGPGGYFPAWASPGFTLPSDAIVHGNSRPVLSYFFRVLSKGDARLFLFVNKGDDRRDHPPYEETASRLFFGKGFPRIDMSQQSSISGLKPGQENHLLFTMYKDSDYPPTMGVMIRNVIVWYRRRVTLAKP